MKSTFILLLVVFSTALWAQTPLCYVYHGCWGATVVAYRTDVTWTSISYDFQRFQGGNWVTIHQSVENFHLVIPGDITVPTQYRTILRNNITSEERISNGVTVDPAKFNDSVIKPNPTITFYWGTSATGGANYVEVIPGPFGLNGMRPPFTYSIKKKNNSIFDQKISTTGIFFTNNIEVNQEYVITVTDYCGQVDSITSKMSFTVFARVTATNCSGASIELGSNTSGENFSQRQPVTFGLAPIDDNIDINNIPESILNGITYNYLAGISTGFTDKRYVVRAKDSYGVFSSYIIINTGLGGEKPFIVSIGPSGGFCNLFVTLAGSHPESGIRIAGSTDDYTFTSGQTIRDIKAGKTYEIVTRDLCGWLSVPLTESFNAWQPVISFVDVANEGCKNRLTVTAQTCSNTPEYRLKITGGSPGVWQLSNVFEYESITGCDTVFVRDGDSPSQTVAFQPVCIDTMQVDAFINPVGGNCGDAYELSVNAYNGVPPFSYAISSDGVNFSDNNNESFFTPLSPGTYTVKVTDACGQTVFSKPEDGVAGAVYELIESGFNGGCGTNEGFLHIVIDFGVHAQVVSPPYKYIVREVINDTGNSIQYGDVIVDGTTIDTDFIISGLPGNKNYGIFITNNCDEPFTPKNRVLNNYTVPGCKEFVTVWDLAIPGGPDTELNFDIATGGTVNYTWETIPPAFSGSGSVAGTTASITGLPAGATIRLFIQPENFERIIINYGIDRNRLIWVENWGSTAWTSMESAFFGCENLQITATDVPDLSGVTSMFQMFQHCTTLNSPANINTWNTSAVTNMSLMFAYASAFDQNIGSWNTSAVTNMRGMLEGAVTFNQDIGSWNTTNVTDMSYMFANTSSFNQNISSWNTAAVTDMSDMFAWAGAFNQNIGSWLLNPEIDLNNLLDYCGMDCNNYSLTLTGWYANPAIPSNRSLGAAGMLYGNGTMAIRDYLTGTKGWTITGDDLTYEACGIIWTGNINTYWHEQGNWVGGVVPTNVSIAVIPSTANNPVIQQDAICLNLTIASGAKVTIKSQSSLTVIGVLTNNSLNGLVVESDINGTGSLIAGSAAGTGTTEVQRYMKGNQWHNVSSPVQQSVAAFLANNTNIPAKSTSRGMTDYNTTNNSWNAYFTDSSAGDMEPAKGYLLRNDADGTVKFNGTVYVGAQSIALSPSGAGWNLIGNPFTSALKVNMASGANNFLAINGGILDPSFVSIYVWNGTQYEIINNASSAEFATTGQGFFVKSTVGAIANFTPEMQVHQPGIALKSGNVIPEIKLLVSTVGKRASTEIKLIEGATVGLDKGFDAGILKADPSFSVFTKLVSNNNNVDFGLQCLPLSNFGTFTIPVGIDLSAGGEVTFSAQSINLLPEIKIVFEDRLLRVFTPFDNETNFYKTTLAANTKGAGRFYLHISDNQVTGIGKETDFKKITAWLERDEIVIGGITENNTIAVLYDLSGRSVRIQNLEKTPHNRVNVNGLTTGIYMLQVTENGKRTSIKLRINGN